MTHNPETNCRFCPAKIRWVTTENGRAFPIDAKPVTVIILTRPADGWKLNRRPWARVVQAWMPHFASCHNYPRRRSSDKTESDFREATEQTALDLPELPERYP